MEEVTKFNNSIDIAKRENTDVMAVSEGLLFDVDTDILNKQSFSIPIAELSTLGSGVSSLVPELRTMTQTTNVNMQGVYRLANADVGDTLKVAKDGKLWGALKTETGKSKFAKFEEAEPLSVVNQTIMPIDPTTMMMAVTLYSIEQQMKSIKEMQEKILSFLEIEKESEIEADLKTLTDVISKYKYNWENEHFIASNHKLVIDIQRTARKHMISYQKKVEEILSSKQFLVAQPMIQSISKDLQKDFKYYRLSLYTFSMASFVELMLSGNFEEDNIIETKSQLEKYSLEYREMYTRCSKYLERMVASSVESGVLNGIGDTGKTVGKFIGKIPFVKDGPVDEFLIKSGSDLKKSVKNEKKNVVKSFAAISDPGTEVFIDKMEDVIQIYNHTSNICFDSKKIYLIKE